MSKVKMRGIERENGKGRIPKSTRLLRTIVAGFVFLQIVVGQWYSNKVHDNGFTAVYAFTPLSSVVTRQPFIATPGENAERTCLLPLNRRCLVQLYETKAMDTSTNSTGKATSIKRGNPQVRTIMSILEDRYDTIDMDHKVKTRDWKKTRNYLYNAIRDDDAFEQKVIAVLHFLDHHLKLPPFVSRKILQESPRILRKPVDSFLIPTSDFLLQLWGRDLFVQAVERNPALLLSSGVGYTKNRKSRGTVATDSKFVNGTAMDTSLNDQSVEDIIIEYTVLSSSAIQRIKGTTPCIFGVEASKVHSVLDFLGSILKNQENDNDDNDEKESIEESLKRKKILGKIILAHPYLLNLSVESNLEPRLQFLAESCDLNPTQVAKVVQTSTGSVLSLSVEQNLKPTMDFLLQEIFHENDATSMLKKCVLTHPQLLGLSLANLKSKVNYFDSIGSSLALRVASRCPAIYSLNLEQNIIPTIDFLARVWGVDIESSTKDRKSNEDFVSMLHEYPNIITLSVESNLQPTMMFFNKTGYTLLNENWELMLPQKPKPNAPSRIRGRYIAASLYNRLLPRWHFCLSRNAVFDEATQAAALAADEAPPPPETPPLHVLVMASDEAFCEAMDFRPESFATFKKEAIPRLKFSSQFDTWLKTGKPIDL
eukprot:CAMPEP_0116117772 /NCGR_PEP_ID=MMETSP0329-20121206/1750_1 /TAXON_ID=697910 /ORGANISM="Pseudo-nitzschia arenysensis, Strain B593" /LENGTH=651 /DNA_ID=CAMNT_0003611357 /DNA_START=21 /DNA_END=1976 /DNA_ORIENTATION=-